MKTGDVIVKVDGTAVTGPEQLKSLISKAPAKELAFDILRDDKPLQLKITPLSIDVAEPMQARTWSLAGWSDWLRSWVYTPPVRITQVGYLDVRQVEKEAASCGPVRVAVRPHHVAVLSGLQTGDIVKRVNGTVIADFSQLSQLIAKSAGVELAFEVERSGQTQIVKVTPPPNERHPDGFGGFETRAIVGISASADRSKLPVTHPSLLAAVASGFEQTGMVVTATLGYIWDVVTYKASAEKIGGLPTIIDVSNQMAQYGIAPIIGLIALLSVSIGLLNLFPIPLLDGGHLLFYGIEAIRGRPLSDQAQEACFRVGLSVVIMLMMLALYNDRFRMLGWLVGFGRLTGVVPPMC
jgi:RIP metalloprotease RseP